MRAKHPDFCQKTALSRRTSQPLCGLLQTLLTYSQHYCRDSNLPKNKHIYILYGPAAIQIPAQLCLFITYDLIDALQVDTEYKFACVRFRGETSVYRHRRRRASSPMRGPTRWWRAKARTADCWCDRIAGNTALLPNSPVRGKWCRGVELNHRPHPYQGCALPLSYRGSDMGREDATGIAEWQEMKIRALAGKEP